MISLHDEIQWYLNSSKAEIWWPYLSTSIVSRSEHFRDWSKNYTTTSFISNGEIEPLKLLSIPSLPSTKLEYLCDAHAQLFSPQDIKQVSLERFCEPRTAEDFGSAMDLIGPSPTLLN